MVNFLWRNLKEIIKDKAKEILFSLSTAAIATVLGWSFNLLGVQTEMGKITIIASLFLSASMPLIILAVATFSTCIVTFAILRRLLPSQRFFSNSKRILQTLNLVRVHLDSRQTNEPFLIFQSIQNLKDTVLKEHEISYPSITPEDEDYFVVWFGVLSSLHGLAVNADWKTAQHMRYDLIYEGK